MQDQGWTADALRIGDGINSQNDALARGEVFQVVCEPLLDGFRALRFWDRGVAQYELRRLITGQIHARSAGSVESNDGGCLRIAAGHQWGQSSRLRCSRPVRYVLDECQGDSPSIKLMR